MLIHELLPIGPVESVFELSESTRGSTLLAASDEWGPLVVELDVPVRLLGVGSTAGPEIVVSYVNLMCNNSYKTYH